MRFSVSLLSNTMFIYHRKLSPLSLHICLDWEKPLLTSPLFSLRKHKLIYNVTMSSNTKTTQVVFNIPSTPHTTHTHKDAHTHLLPSHTRSHYTVLHQYATPPLALTHHSINKFFLIVYRSFSGSASPPFSSSAGAALTSEAATSAAAVAA
jgi:hypothetical protein